MSAATDGPPRNIKKRRKKKDPNAPKRPKSAFMFFMAANRLKIIKEKGLNVSKVTSVGKAMGAAWKSISAADRAEYDASSTADKARYKKENAAYKLANPIIKKPVSSYMFFVQDARPR